MHEGYITNKQMTQTHARDYNDTQYCNLYMHTMKLNYLVTILKVHKALIELRDTTPYVISQKYASTQESYEKDGEG